MQGYRSGHGVQSENDRPDRYLDGAEIFRRTVAPAGVRIWRYVLPSARLQFSFIGGAYCLSETVRYRFVRLKILDIALPYM